VNQPAVAPAVEDDVSLLARMASGDEASLGLFYDRWEHVVRAVAMRVTGDAMAAEDVVEDVFWQAWRQADRFDGARGAVSAWLLTITRSRALDRRRRADKHREVESLDAPGGVAAVSGRGADADAFVHVPEDPLEAAALGERSERLRAAVGSLPPEQREALELGYFAGLSQSEIATRIGIPLGTVKTRTRLALKKLRDELAFLQETRP
jgi:RNA polymerase sigma-70 factor (ECF subfamily)